LIEWLLNNPVRGVTDINFLKKECLWFQSTVGVAEVEHQVASDGKWHGAAPYLCLILPHQRQHPVFALRGSIDLTSVGCSKHLHMLILWEQAGSSPQVTKTKFLLQNGGVPPKGYEDFQVLSDE
jgi:hypothetical protein